MIQVLVLLAILWIVFGVWSELEKKEQWQKAESIKFLQYLDKPTGHDGLMMRAIVLLRKSELPSLLEVFKSELASYGSPKEKKAYLTKFYKQNESISKATNGRGLLSAPSATISAQAVN